MGYTFVRRLPVHTSTRILLSPGNKSFYVSFGSVKYRRMHLITNNYISVTNTNYNVNTAHRVTRTQTITT